MLKLSCHVSKKLPVPGREFSSQSFACGIEAELADAADAPALKAKAEELFNLVQRAVEDEIAKAGAAVHEPAADSEGGNGQYRATPQARAPRIPQNGGNGNGGRARRNGKPVMATGAQLKAIRAICAERGLQIEEVLADWNGDPERLTIKEASEVIDALKRNDVGSRR